MSGAWWLGLPGALIWWATLAAPWRPWSTREHLEPDGPRPEADLSQVTALIPARDEAAVIGRTLAALTAQGRGLQVVVVDDQSGDETAAIARDFAGVAVLAGRPLPAGWAGKLWALEQGLGEVRTPLTLLLDADIELAPGLLPALAAHKLRQGAALASLMAWLSQRSFWDRLLLPAFVYYFKLLYPFALANAGRPRWLAAAAGGCVLVDTAALRGLGGFAGLRDALIDDCTLAMRLKRAGNRTWVGLSRGVISLRPYGSLASIQQMVVRSAFTQLRYSTGLLLLVTAVFAAAYWLPLAALALPGARTLGAAALAAMALSYLPVLRYYRRSLGWALLLPLTGTLFLAMTWSSALRYWRGVRSQWKGRSYAR
ncbi:MAG: glycosyltransferase [Gammaproteobacteria bacterium]|nr:glycosyltransferase [Gammaproteobacteria bacterium]